MTDPDFHDEIIDEICICAYLVALGDDEVSEEESSSLGEVRAYCRNLIDAREAVELLESTGDIKRARKLLTRTSRLFITRPACSIPICMTYKSRYPE